MLTTRIAATTVAVGLVLAGCSSGSDEQPPVTPTAMATKNFEPPAGVTLTAPGSQLDAKSAATVIHQIGDRTASAIRVSIIEVKKGSIKDFEFFSLDAQTKKSTPFYVTVKVKNQGPAGLGGASLPIYAHDDSDATLPASDIVGTFKPCQGSSLPASFLPGATAKLCLVYLVPKGRALVSVDLQTGSAEDAITWLP